MRIVAYVHLWTSVEAHVRIVADEGMGIGVYAESSNGGYELLHIYASPALRIGASVERRIPADIDVRTAAYAWIKEC